MIEKTSCFFVVKNLLPSGYRCPLYINGESIQRERKLKNRDTISFGDVDSLVKYVFEKTNYDEHEEISEEYKALYENFKCSVCLEIIFDPICPPCQHVVCQDCIFRLVRDKKCPVCRDDLSVVFEKVIRGGFRVFKNPALTESQKILERHLPKKQKLDREADTEARRARRALRFVDEVNFLEVPKNV